MADEHIQSKDDAPASPPPPPSRPTGILGFIEWAGNKLPDPAMLFVWALGITWVLSFALSYVEFPNDIDPRTVNARNPEGSPIQIKNQLSPEAMTTFFTGMVKTFTGFHPLGVVLVALLGVGVAEHTGLINALIRGLLSITPGSLLTPMLILVAIVSHSAGDTGYVLVIPLGGVLFQAAGRHPLTGIVVAFAAVSGGFSANFLPSALDPLLQGLSLEAAHIIDDTVQINPLCNYYFTSASSLLIMGVGWILTDYFIEPRLQKYTPVDSDATETAKLEPLNDRERLGVIISLLFLVAFFGFIVAIALPENSALRGSNGGLTEIDAPLMQMIVPLIFFVFLVPGIAYGYVAGTVHSHRDIVKGMSHSMSTMGYYLVLAFFAAQFTYAFGQSNIGALLAIKGAKFLQSLNLSGPVTILGIIVLAGFVNLLIGSASAKWALLAPIFVPMLMRLNLSPDLTQAAYRVGDSSTNIVTPLMPYFPLVVAFAQRYVKNTGIGTLITLMIPYSICFFLTWSVLLVVFWTVLGWPLGLDATYTYSPPQ